MLRVMITCLAADRQDFSLSVIPQSEFDHGCTRTFGFAICAHRSCGFLTQDAILGMKRD